MLVQTINTASTFADMFNQCGRGDQFSYDGLMALHSYLEELSADMGQDIQIDVIGLCCEYSEYDDICDLADAYNQAFTEEQLQDVEEHKEDIIEYFYDNTQVIEVGGGSYIIADF